MPHVVKFNGLYNLPKEILSLDNDKIFDYINNFSIWGGRNNESVSGKGSTLKYTVVYREQLKHFIKTYPIKNIKFFDAPCGDLNWIKEFFNSVDYIGGDISNDLVKKLNLKYPNIKLTQFDVINDKFPEADIWHCRHCLFHLSLNDILKALTNYTKSNIPFALITNHFLPDSITYDIPTGNFRYLDLTNFPFYLPKPRLWLLDSVPQSTSCAMASGFWTREQIKIGIKNFKKNFRRN